MPSLFKESDLGLISTQTWVEQIHYFTDCPSTNDFALEQLSLQDQQLINLILSEEQHAGRGRGENTWSAGSGALLFSLYLPLSKYPLPKEKWPLLSLACGVASAEAFKSIVKDPAQVMIKWPNDIYLNDKKCMGILVEPHAQAGGLVIGIGLNVSNEISEGIESSRILDCIKPEFETPNLHRELLIWLIQRLEHCLVKLLKDESCLIDKCNHWSFLNGKQVQLTGQGVDVTGLCGGVDQRGALLIEGSPYFAGSVRVLQG